MSRSRNKETRQRTNLDDLVQQRHRRQQPDLKLLLWLNPVLLRRDEVKEELRSVGEFVEATIAGTLEVFAAKGVEDREEELTVV
jgi:hypothetical protein